MAQYLNFLDEQAKLLINIIAYYEDQAKHFDMMKQYLLKR
eukprot:CAMPEP_0182911628 /NCGR_PEP_ID=MMETSP0034_2-20130328/37048_1 /TAXON_ID=156128 /ORGANISM="Nephroselmis pyriformis, Strain CCMP717" /LENGTH=39 /DNA_ID= /DNA_START= /DNA_END= /DNA_ORIENTATION=